MGRVFRIRKRYCHLTVVLEEYVESKPTSVAGTEKGKAEKAETAVKNTKTAARKKPVVRKATGKKPAVKKVTTSKTSARSKKPAKGAE